MRIGFIGAGNMGTAIIAGNLRQGISPQQIVAIELDADKRKHLTEVYGIDAVASLADTKPVDILVLSVKPQHLKEVIEQIRPQIQAQLIISIAAGIPCQTLAGWLATDTPIVRVMPNTPAMIGAGMTGLYTPAVLTDAHTKIVNTLFGAIGKTIWVDSESLIDAVTAISGSGPAYFFYMMEAIRDAGLQLGIDEADVDTLVQQTALGAAQLAIHANQAFSVLRQQVTSKGGTTEAAIRTLDEQSVNQTMAEAVMAAFRRSVEMSKAS